VSISLGSVFHKVDLILSQLSSVIAKKEYQQVQAYILPTQFSQTKGALLSP
jgi:hypothetical protein